MPSAKPFSAIETIPGTMIRSESAKNMLRRPTKSSRRTRACRAGAATASGSAALTGSPSGAMSAVCSSGSTSAFASGSSDTVYSEQRRSAEASARHHDRQQVVGDDDGRDQARDDADAERESEATHGRGTDEAEHETCEQSRGVGVADRRPRAPNGCIDGRCDSPAGPDLFFEPFED